MEYFTRCPSPLGELLLASDGEALTGLWLPGQNVPASAQTAENRNLPVFAETRRWLEQYFAGHAPDFTPPLRPQGTPFRQEVWEILLAITYGTTRTYGEIAAQLARRRGIPRMSAQAVGGAVGHNPVSIIIPCHRVVGADGCLTGYAGGVEKKAALLRLEGIVLTS